MRFVENDDLSFCLTVSTGIKRDVLLDILGRQEVLAQPQTFDDFPWEQHRPGLNGALNVFEADGDDFLITLENNGFLGVTFGTVKSVAALGGLNHYAAIYQTSGGTGAQYVEVQDGTVVANFNPMTDEPSDAVADFFQSVIGDPRAAREGMVKALEYRMSEPGQQFTIAEEWLTLPTTTYLIDYRTKRA